jgi:hypothetical protein
MTVPTKQAAAAALLCVTAAVAGCTAGPTAGAGRAGPARAVLSCGDSAGQQGGSESGQPVNGVESVALDGDNSLYDVLPAWRSRHGPRYLVWKVFLAVAPGAAPFRVVTVTSPSSARLFYASPAGWGAASGAKTIPPPPRAVQLAVCGRRFTGYTGGILITHPGCVILSVAGPKIRPRTVAVPILVAHCPLSRPAACGCMSPGSSGPPPSLPRSTPPCWSATPPPRNTSASTAIPPRSTSASRQAASPPSTTSSPSRPAPRTPAKPPPPSPRPR